MKITFGIYSLFIIAIAQGYELFHARSMRKLDSLMTVDFAKKSAAVSASKKTSAKVVQIEHPISESWKMDGILDILRNGGVGVVPTDTSYAFVTPINSNEGVLRLMKLKDNSGRNKPFSVLCKDFSMISYYTSSITQEKWVYKLLRTCLPGPFTFILPASKEVPKVVLDHRKHGLKTWRRKEIGVRIPDDSILQYILENMDVPLLSGSVPGLDEDILDVSDLPSLDDSSSNIETDDIDDFEYGEDNLDDSDFSAIVETRFPTNLQSQKWMKEVDFLVEKCTGDGDNYDPLTEFIYGNSEVKEKGAKKKKDKRSPTPESELSTVIDLTSGEPIIRRHGKGKVKLSDFFK